MNRHTRSILDVLSQTVDRLDFDDEALDDELRSAVSDINVHVVDLKAVRAELVSHLSKKALRTADAMMKAVERAVK